MKIIRNPQRTEFKQQVTRVYLRCLQCKSNLSIHNIKDQFKTLQKQENGKTQSMILIMKKDRKINEPSTLNNSPTRQEILQNITEFKAIEISVQDNNQLALVCRKCSNKAGWIIRNCLAFSLNLVEETVITYKPVKNKAPQKQHEQPSNQRLYHYLAAYTSHSFENLQKSLDSIDITKLQKMNRQLQSFIKFYHQWKNKKSMGSSKKTIAENNSFLQGSLCSLGKLKSTYQS